MSTLLPPWPLLSAFLAASLALAITPGPAVLYIVTRSLAQGRRFGLASVAGVALGNLGNALGAALGLAALFAISATAFTIVKFGGALYLVYLGISALRAPAAAEDGNAPSPAPLSRIFRDGFVVALLNPKTAFFFAAFLPQFMTPDVAPLPQSLALASLFIAVAATTDTSYALAAGTLAPFLTRTRGVRAVGRYLSGTAFIGLGIFAAVAGSRPQ